MYEECRDELGCKLTDAKKIVDGYLEAEEPAEDKELRLEVYRREHEQLQKMRQRKRRQEKLKRAAGKPAEFILYMKDGRSASAELDITIRSARRQINAHSEMEPASDQVVAQTFGNSMTKAILDVLHLHLDFAPEDFAELVRAHVEDILALELRPAEPLEDNPREGTLADDLAI